MPDVKLLAEVITDESELNERITVLDADHLPEETVGRIRAMTSRALLKGHFLLESGQHSDRFLRFRTTASNRRDLDLAAELLVAKMNAAGVRFDAVACRDAVDRELGEAIADARQKRVVIAEADDENRLTGALLDESALYPHDRVLVVGDLTTTGGLLEEISDLIHKRKGHVVAAAVFAARDSARAEGFARKLPLFRLVDVSLTDRTYGDKKSNRQLEEKISDCPACQRGEEPVPSPRIH